ncbi:MAG: hypothetical protein LBM09_02825 [Candidatus Nomurabacteria bacterium]|jgi:hypothetical protein|nr:hypothetical protein [Candidatus Nomurabacteria bacterium]
MGEEINKNNSDDTKLTGWEILEGGVGHDTKETSQVSVADIRKAIMNAIKDDPDLFFNARMNQNPEEFSESWAKAATQYKNFKGIRSYSGIRGSEFSDIADDVKDTYDKVDAIMRNGYKENIIEREDFQILSPKQKMRLRGLIQKQLESQVDHWKTIDKEVNELEPDQWDFHFNKALAQLNADE